MKYENYEKVLKYLRFFFFNFLYVETVNWPPRLCDITTLKYFRGEIALLRR